MAEISAIPQQPQLGRLAQFLRYLETQNAPEFLPRQLDVMGLVRQLTLPQASTVENLSYGNLPFTMPPSGTGAMIPQVKTGRKAEVADLVGMLGGVPGGRAVMDVGTKLSNEAADAIVRAITRNPAATAPQVIQETAMPFMQAVAPRAPGLLETPAKSDLGFYSALEQATMPLQNKGTGAQFLAQIEKTAGVKPEEVKWTGLDEFLKSRQNVTKQEVQDYLAANRVNLQEVRLGEGTVKSFEQWAADQGFGPEALRDFGPTLRNSYEAFKENASQKVGAAKFSQYTLPGGENYREILLTLPESMEAKMFRDLELRVNAGEKLKPEELQKYYDLVDAQAFKNQFFGSHYDQANILAHMRVNDRVVDGKKTLFIEEIQSDWHQAGRKKGYATKPTRSVADIENEASQVNRERSRLLDEAAALPDSRMAEFNAMNDRIRELTVRARQLGDEFDAAMKPKDVVPDAPFKTTWHELTLKRAIQEASEKGYDQIAFTTGKTQAERYDLSKQVDYIDYIKEGPDQYRLAIVGKNGQGIDLPQETFSSSELENFVGKEVAERIAKGEGQTGGGRTTLRGPDLQIGGEGMKGFYDQILPKTLDKLGKKFDAKVGKTEMDGVEVWAMDITPKMRESVLTKGQPLFAATPAIPAAGLLGDENE